MSILFHSSVKLVKNWYISIWCYTCLEIISLSIIKPGIYNIFAFEVSHLLSIFCCVFLGKKSHIKILCNKIKNTFFELSVKQVLNLTFNQSKFKAIINVHISSFQRQPFKAFSFLFFSFKALDSSKTWFNI